MINEDDKTKSWLDQVGVSQADQRAYGEELAITIGAETIARAMEAAGLTRAALAERLDCHKSFVTRVLSGPQNVTLSTLGSFLWACGVEVGGISVAPMGAQGFIEEAIAVVAPIQINFDQMVSVGGLDRPALAKLVTGSAPTNQNLALAA